MNVASKWGRTKRTYEFLKTLRRNEKVVVVLFPSAEFKGQEFLEDKDIATFLDEKFGINPKEMPNLVVLERSNIRKDPTNPIWQYLKTNSDKDPHLKTRWNFSTTFIVTGDDHITRLDDVDFEKIENAVSKRLQVGKM